MGITQKARLIGALWLAVVAATACATIGGSSQSSVPLLADAERALKRYFEGKTVVVRIDMPATKDGVDVYLRRASPIDYPQYGRRLREHGTALRPGELVTITLIKLKDEHIEFHLGGGGWGTFWDERGDVGANYEGEGDREKELREAIDAEQDARRRAAMQEEYDDLRRDRERENERRRLMAEEVEQAKRGRIRQNALDAGSRFNIRFEAALTPGDVEPEVIIAALADYVDFPPESFGSLPEVDAGQATADRIGALRKGLLWEEVVAIFGTPTEIVERMEGQLLVVTCAFEYRQQRIDTVFVEGVLIRYTVSSM